MAAGRVTPAPAHPLKDLPLVRGQPGKDVPAGDLLLLHPPPARQADLRQLDEKLARGDAHRPAPQRDRLLDGVAGGHTHLPPLGHGGAQSLNVIVRALRALGEYDLHPVHVFVRAHGPVRIVAVEDDDHLFAGIARIVGNQVHEPLARLPDGQLLLARHIPRADDVVAVHQQQRLHTRTAVMA